MAVQGATVLFVPTNNGLPKKYAWPKLVLEARNADIARAVENRIWVIRADVAGQNGELMSYGSSGIVDPDGKVVQAKLQSTDVLAADIETSPRTTARKRGRPVNDWFRGLVGGSQLPAEAESRYRASAGK